MWQLAKCREENIMFSSKQTHKLHYFICYHLESGWHVTRPNQGLSLGRGKSLGTRLKQQLLQVFVQQWAEEETHYMYFPLYTKTIVAWIELKLHTCNLYYKLARIVPFE